MRKRKWDINAANMLTWKHGDYWPILSQTDDGSVLLAGYAVVCPHEVIPRILHRHWYKFAGNEEGWEFDKKWGLKESPELECDVQFHFKIEKGKINASNAA